MSGYIDCNCDAASMASSRETGGSPHIIVGHSPVLAPLGGLGMQPRPPPARMHLQNSGGKSHGDVVQSPSALPPSHGTTAPVDQFGLSGYAEPSRGRPIPRGSRAP